MSPETRSRIVTVALFGALVVPGTAGAILSLPWWAIGGTAAVGMIGVIGLQNALDPLVAAAPKAPLCCSFCGKSQQHVRKLIAGPSVYICDECIALCNEILSEDAAPKPPPDVKPPEQVWSPPEKD